MATLAQVTANRLNAQKSTGPRSDEGKAAVRFNALKHGLDAQSLIIPGEDPELYQALADSYHATFHPSGAAETFHVQTMIRSDWEKRRYQALEVQLYRSLLAGHKDLAVALLSGAPEAKLLTRVQRQLAAAERMWYRAYGQLNRARGREASAHDDFFEAVANAPLPTGESGRSGLFPPIVPKTSSRPPFGLDDNPALRL